ncbi:MAG: metallophosphoesterase [Calditrichaceae bacterium]|nr:metallophosphoesterase [Calditrichaceae bacterium]
MRSVVFAIVMLVFLTLLTFGARALLRHGNKNIWEFSFLDKFAKYLPYTGWFFYLLFGAALAFKWKYLLFTGVTGLSIVMIVSLIMILTMPVSLLMGKISNYIPKRKKNSNILKYNQDRRLFLKTAAAALPVFTIGTTTNGFAGAFQNVKIPGIDMFFENLPTELDGFKIWHLSDLHLGYYYQLDDLERLLLNAESESVDLVVITGDVADDLSQLTDALKLIDQKKSTYPKLVSVGNHEYFRGIQEVRRRIDTSPIPLLLNNHHIVNVNGVKLLIGGMDDPVRMHTDNVPFFERSIKQILINKPEYDFSILMSHRPKALNVVPDFNIDLVLAGHTHGAQLGFNNRSIFEPMWEENYLWGKYSKGKSQLYTSSGVGHWFPFRLGCPAEAPIITLKKA